MGGAVAPWNDQDLARPVLLLVPPQRSALRHEHIIARQLTQSAPSRTAIWLSLQRWCVSLLSGTWACAQSEILTFAQSERPLSARLSRSSRCRANRALIPRNRLLTARPRIGEVGGNLPFALVNALLSHSMTSSTRARIAFGSALRHSAATSRKFGSAFRPSAWHGRHRTGLRGGTHRPPLRRSA